MKILVLGGTGAMGVDLVEILARRGEEVTVTSRIERKSKFENVTYVQGNAHDITFLKTLLDENFDAVIDFMIYKTEEFETRCDRFLDAAKQYLFLSSSRVYADSKTPINEKSPRLLDVTTDAEYLKTDEYALAKARQENLLRGSGKANWTIIRPYITYSNQRLQLGVYEKELWLNRALHDKTVIFPRAIAEKYTTMSCGHDVANGIAALIGNERAMGEAFHITTDKAILWADVLEIYQRVLTDVTGHGMRIVYTDDPRPIYEAMGNKYQMIYDRLFDRRFDNSKLLQAGNCGFEPPEIGLKRCLREFLERPIFRGRPGFAMMDRLIGERTTLAEIQGIKQKTRYLVGRYLPQKTIVYLKSFIR